LLEDFLYPRITGYENEIPLREKLMQDLCMEPTYRGLLRGHNSDLLFRIPQQIEDDSEIGSCFPINDFHEKRKKQNGRARAMGGGAA
jgi:hypothetical protein